MTATPDTIKQTMQQYAAIWRPGASLPEGATAADLQQARAHVESAQQALARIKVQCHDCVHFDIDSCALYGNVPDDFKKSEGACPEWRFDGVPF